MVRKYEQGLALKQKGIIKKNVPRKYEQGLALKEKEGIFKII